MEHTPPSRTRKLTLLVLAIILLGVLAMVAITMLRITAIDRSNQSAEKLLLQASEKMNSLDSARLELRMWVKIPNSEVVITGQGVIKRGAGSYMTFQVNNQSAEVLTVNATDSYLRGADGVWKLLPQDDIYRNFGKITYEYFETIEKPEIYINHVKLADEPIDGHSCYHIRFDYDYQAAVNAYGDPNTQKQIQDNPDAQKTIAGMSTKEDLWIDQDDYYTRQSQLIINLGSNTPETEIHVKISNFNEDVFIPSPK